MLLIVAIVLFAAGFSGLAYLYGVHIGMQAGKIRGRAIADAEWAVWAEHGAL